MIENNIEFGRCETLNLLNKVEFLVLDEVDKLGQSCYLTDTVKILNEVYLKQSRTTKLLNFSDVINNSEANQDGIIDINKIMTDELEKEGMINHKEVKQKDLEIFNEIQINKELNYKNEDLNMYEIETKKNFLHRRMQTFLASATIMLDSRPVPSSKKKGSLKRKRDNQKGSKKKKLVETFAHRMLKFIRFQKDHPVFVIDLMKEEKSPKNLKTE